MHRNEDLFKVFLNDVKKIYVTYKTEDVNIVAKISERVYCAKNIFEMLWFVEITRASCCMTYVEN